MMDYRIRLANERDIKNRKVIESYGYTIIDDKKVTTKKTLVKCLDSDGYKVNVMVTRIVLGQKPSVFYCNDEKVYNLGLYMNRQGCELLSSSYVNADDKVKYIASCGHENTVVVNKFTHENHGRKCINCARSGGNYNIKIAERNKSKWKKIKANVYIIRVYNDNEHFWKIGITKTKISERFYGRLSNYSYSIEGVYHTTLYEASYLEKELHLLNKKFSYVPLNKFGGWTECFSNLDIETFMKGVGKYGCD